MPSPGEPVREDKFETAVVLVAAGKTYQEAADAAGIHLSTIKRWIADFEFKKRVNELRMEMLSDCMGILSASLTKAANRLNELMDSDKDAVARQACVDAVGIVMKIREQIEIEQRVATLEAKLK